MLASLAFIFPVGLALASLCQKIHLPRIVGLLFTGILLGILAGWLLSAFFACTHEQGRYIRSSVKVILIMDLSFLFIALEDWLKGTAAVSGLLAVVSMAVMIHQKCPARVTERLAAGVTALIMIAVALLIRSIGVFLSVAGTNLNRKERIFCAIACLPKATVQAAIGSVPLARGLACGKMVLSVSVLAILITAPSDSLGIEASYPHLLHQEKSLI